MGGTKTFFFYSDEGLIGEYGAIGNEIKTYGYAPNSMWTTDPLFQKIGTSYYWYQNDHLGAPQKIVDASGRVVWAATYDSFGNIQVAVAEIENNLRFPGQYYDEETGLHYNHHRYYDPKTGRYLSPDPIGLDAGMNLFAFLANNPTIHVDPFGLSCQQITPWQEITVVQKPKFLYSHIVPTWEKISEWNLLPLPDPETGRVAEIMCGCLWEFRGYRKENVYERIIVLESTFECCDETTGRTYRNKEHKEFSVKSREIEKLEREILFNPRRDTTYGSYLGSGVCGCNPPSFVGRI